MTKEKIAEALEEIATLLELKGRKSVQNSRLPECRPLHRSFRRRVLRSAKSGNAGKDPRHRESDRGKNQRTGHDRRAKFLRRIARRISLRHSRTVFHSRSGREKNQGALRKVEKSARSRILQAACESRVEWRSYQDSGRRRRRRFAMPSLIARSIPVHFNSGKSPPRLNSCAATWRAHTDASQVSVAGSFRRRKEIVRDLDFIVASKSPDGDHGIFWRPSICRRV